MVEKGQRHQMIKNIQLQDFLHSQDSQKQGFISITLVPPNVSFPQIAEPSGGAKFLLIQSHL